MNSIIPLTVLRYGFCSTHNAETNLGILSAQTSMKSSLIPMGEIAINNYFM